MVAIYETPVNVTVSQLLGTVSFSYSYEQMLVPLDRVNSGPGVGGTVSSYQRLDVTKTRTLQ